MDSKTQPKKFEVNVTYNGVTKPVVANPEEAVQALLQAAINQFTVTEARHLLALFDTSSVEITDENQSVSAAGVKPGARLVLRQSTVKGG